MALKVVDPPTAPPALTEAEACEQLAAFHREIAAALPLDSGRRALALRCAARWERIGGLRRPLEVVG
jgi:hypothetical protein